jgi:hypothetical protein
MTNATGMRAVTVADPTIQSFENIAPDYRCVKRRPILKSCDARVPYP